jgi:hypothetical protein
VNIIVVIYSMIIEQYVIFLVIFEVIIGCIKAGLIKPCNAVISGYTRNI